MLTKRQDAILGIVSCTHDYVKLLQSKSVEQCTAAYQHVVSTLKLFLRTKMLSLKQKCRSERYAIPAQWYMYVSISMMSSVKFGKDR